MHFLHVNKTRDFLPRLYIIISAIPIRSSKGVNFTFSSKKPTKIKAFFPSLKHCRGIKIKFLSYDFLLVLLKNCVI